MHVWGRCCIPDVQSGKITSFWRKIKEKSGKNVRQNVYKPCLDLYYASLLKRNNCKLLPIHLLFLTEKCHFCAQEFYLHICCWSWWLPGLYCSWKFRYLVRTAAAFSLGISLNNCTLNLESLLHLMQGFLIQKLWASKSVGKKSGVTN